MHRTDFKRSLTAPTILLFLCALALPLLAITDARAQSTDLSGIAHVAFRVSSIGKTRGFYQKLGFEEAFARTKDGTTTQSFIKINDLQFVELYPTTSTETNLGLMHLCFQSPDLEALYAAYRQRGLNPTPVRKAGAGNLLFTLAGPERQNIEYTQYMPGSLHENDDSLHLGPHRIAIQFTSVALTMRDPSAADTFYIGKLSFHLQRTRRASLLLLPGTSGQSVRFKPVHDTVTPDITFATANLRHTIHVLKTDGFTVHVTRHTAYVTDPDGNILGFSSSAAKPSAAKPPSQKAVPQP